MHGIAGGAPKGKRNAFKHGAFTNETKTRDYYPCADGPQFDRRKVTVDASKP
jgi:hypothetical protein